MQDEYVTREEFEQAIITMNTRLDQIDQKIEIKHVEQCEFVRECMEILREWHREEIHEQIGIMQEDTQHRIDAIAEYRRID